MFEGSAMEIQPCFFRYASRKVGFVRSNIKNNTKPQRAQRKKQDSEFMMQDAKGLNGPTGSRENQTKVTKSTLVK
jgi:hypothetical protein